MKTIAINVISGIYNCIAGLVIALVLLKLVA